MKRTQGYVTRILARRLRELPEVIQDDLASALDRDRSAISHMLAGRHNLPADELETWCDVLETIEPLEAIARRLGYRLTPLPKNTPTSGATVERRSWDLLRLVGSYGEALASRMHDGPLCEADRETLGRLLADLGHAVEELRVRLAPGDGSPAEVRL